MNAHEAIEQQKDEEFLERFERLIRPKLQHDHSANAWTALARTGKSEFGE